jgi:RsmE family RNA methyltransferase
MTLLRCDPHWRRCWLPHGLLPSEGEPASLTTLELAQPDTCHYLRTVCRVKTGDWLTGVSPASVDEPQGQGWQYPIQVQAVTRTTVTVAIALQAGSPCHSSPWPWRLGLACGYLKEAAWDELLPQATALGVDVIQPLLTERTQNQHQASERTQKRAERIQTLLATAALQCERGTLPQVATPLALHAWLSQLPHHDGAVVLRERFASTTALSQIMSEWRTHLTPNTTPTLWCVVGPEGGWSDDEAKQWDALATTSQCDTQTSFWQLSVSPWVLRSELAAMAGLALLSASPTLQTLG